MLQGKLELAESELKDVRAQESKLGLSDRESSTTFYLLGEVERRRGDAAAAVTLDRRGLDAARLESGEGSRFAAMAHHYLGLALRDNGDDVGAERELRAALASYAAYIPQAEHPLAANVRYDLAMLLLSRVGDRMEGLRLLEETVALREKILGADEARTRQAREALHKVQGLAKKGLAKAY
jgi:hypothetical protein